VTPISVVVPDAAAARELASRLRPLETTAVERDGDWHVELRLGGDEPLAHVLTAVDAWLSDSGPDEVRVHVGEHEYAMHRDAGPRVSAGADHTPGSRPRSNPA
jgi:hypothetical protein